MANPRGGSRGGSRAPRMMMTILTILKTPTIEGQVILSKATGLEVGTMVMTVTLMIIDNFAIGGGVRQKRGTRVTIVMVMMLNSAAWSGRLLAAQTPAGKSDHLGRPNMVIDDEASSRLVLARSLRGRMSARLASLDARQAYAAHAMSTPKSRAAFAGRALRHKLGAANGDSATPVMMIGNALTDTPPLAIDWAGRSRMHIGGGGIRRAAVWRRRRVVIIRWENRVLTSAPIQAEVTVRPTNGIETIGFTACVSGTVAPGTLADTGESWRNRPSMSSGIHAR